VKLIDVRDGLYADRRNEPEARRVVDTALRHMRERPEESLGVVALNATQRELLENLFDEALKRDPAAQRYVDERASGLEPFFIKNLENVQGDERDVIYVSVTYGRNENGKVYQRFGPINGPTGHRRLNVLFTRARLRVVVFASMLAEDIQINESSAWGLRALKGYLHFARTGVLEQAQLSGREPDSDFEVQVAEALRARGYQAVAQVGVAGYFIDIAIKHPRKPDAFILGIECDGRTYHSSASARDRDRLRQSVLEDLGWRIHRIWSTDWFKQGEVEVARVVGELERILRKEGQTPPTSAIEHTGIAQAASEDQAVATGALTDGDAGAGWQGEAAEQPLTREEARERLLELRAEMQEAMPSVKEREALLRDDLLDVLLHMRPRTRDEWIKKIPMDLRIDTDGEHVKRFLPEVFKVLAMMA
jgi:very-short-patch-repair endonuclease